MPFEYHNVLKDASAMQRMLEFSKGKRLVPIIVENARIFVGYGGGT